MQKKLPDPSKDLKVEQYIEFNKWVSNINWRSDDTVTVTCDDKTTYNAQHVIVTIPLGVMKETYKTLFTPEPPPCKANSIQYLQFGTVDKIIMEWNPPFWGEDFTGRLKMVCNRLVM